MQQRDDLPDFSGSVLLVNLGVASTKDLGMESWLLEYPEWSVVGGRLFLAGRVPEIFENEWIAGREVSVSWERVTSYVLFQSREEYTQQASKYKPTFRERFLR